MHANLSSCDIQNMFYECSALETLDLSNFNTDKVTGTIEIFNYCDSLNTVTLSDSIKKEISDQISPTEGGDYVSPGMWVADGGDAAGTLTIPTIDSYAAAGTYRAKGVSYTLSFDLNGITGTAEDMTVTYNSPIGELPSVTKKGYRLNWKKQ